MIQHKIILIILALLVSNQITAKEIVYNTGLVPEPYELTQSVKEANPFQIRHRGLPSRVDLSPFMPPVGYQGKQSSCVAWSTAYATKSYLEYVERKKAGWELATEDGSPNYKAIFSPAFIYNQINGGRDNGSSIFAAMKLVVDQGAVPWEVMPYEENNYTRKPDSSILKIAAAYKAADFLRLRYNEPEEIKMQLAAGKPVVAGLVIFENFYNLKGDTIYKNAAGKPAGGHAVTLVGYDDSRNAFKFINSWSDQWGDHGYGYIDYKWFTQSCKSAYVMIDAVETKKESDTASLVHPDNTQKEKGGPPTEIYATQGNFKDRIVLTWQGVENAIGYEIYRKNISGSFSKIGLSTKATFEDTGVEPGIAYSYKIATVFEDSVSDLNEGEITGYASSEGKNIPGKISGLHASNGLYSTKITLSWEPLENAKGYHIYKLNGNKYTRINTTTNTTYSDIRATANGANEYYRIAGFNDNGIGEESEAAVGRTLAKNQPAPPLSIIASRGEYKDKITVKWSRTDNAISYIIYKYPVKEKKWKLAATTTLPFWEDKNPEKGIIYYSVAARSSIGTSRFSEYVAGFSDPNIRRAGKRLSAPEELTIQLKDNLANLKWSKVPHADEYNLWLKERGENKWIFIGSTNAKTTSLSTTLPAKEKIYLFSVTAKSILGGDSEFAKPVSAVVSIPKPAVITRSFGGESKLEKFKGKWTAMQWDGSEVKNVVLEIASDETNTEYKVIFNQKVIFQGPYIQNSPIIQKEGFSIKLSGDEDSLLVNVKDEKILSKKDELAFLKE